MEGFILYSICLILGGVGAWFIACFGYEFGLVDLPNERSSHAIPTPKGGGIGILAAMIFVSISINIPISFWGPAAILSMFSFWGDRFEISPWLRLIVQFAAGVIVTTGITGYDLHWFQTSLLIITLSLFIVGTANYYNFMDGINGIAGITGSIGFGLLAYYGFIIRAEQLFITFAICMSLSCLGFLPFNLPKARVFMGDVGSILLGFVFAGMVARLSRSFLDFICLAGFLFPFYADEITTMIVRLKNRENLAHPHRKHLYQILANEYCISHCKVSSSYGFVQLLVGVTILSVKNIGTILVMLVLLLYLIFFAILSCALRKRLERNVFCAAGKNAN